MQTSPGLNSPIALKPTSVAPMGACGVATFETGDAENQISIELRSLTPGVYEISATKKSSRDPEFLARVTIVDPTASSDLQANDNEKVESRARVAEFLDTRVQAELPPALAVSDINQILVYDKSGNALLVGDTK
jgi:hypothetical protein